jgi:hypothetical protein
MYNVTNEFPLFFRFIAIKIGQKVAESSNVILPRLHALPNKLVRKSLSLTNIFSINVLDYYHNSSLLVLTRLDNDVSNTLAY